MSASTLSGQLRRSLLLKILSKPAPSREDLSSVIELTAAKIVDQLQCQSMTLYLVEGEQISFRHVYYSPTLWGTTRPRNSSSRRWRRSSSNPLPKGTGNVGKVIETGQPLFFTDGGPEAMALKKMNTGFEVRSMLTVPLKANVVIGAIQLLNKEIHAGTNGRFEQKDLVLLQEVAEYSATLMQRMLDPQVPAQQRGHGQVRREIFGSAARDQDR